MLDLVSSGKRLSTKAMRALSSQCVGFNSLVKMNEHASYQAVWPVLFQAESKAAF